MTHSQRRFDFRVAVVAAVALLFAQIGAMTHAYAHLRGSDQPSVHSSLGAGHEICGDCLNYAPLLSAAGSPASVALHLPPAPTTVVEVRHVSRAANRPLISFRSRAPPVTN